MASSLASPTTHRLFIKDSKNNLTFLIDTGADISVLPCTPSDNRTATPNFNLSAANGSLISTYGIRLLEVNLGLRRSFCHEFVLAEVNRPIIGADFLTKFKLLVDLTNKCLIDSITKFTVNALSANVDTPTPRQYSIENQFGDLLKSFPSLIQPPDFNFPVKHNVVHRISTEGQLPFAKPRRLEPPKHKSAQLEFEHMVRLGVCQISSSSVSSPLHMVHKNQDGGHAVTTVG